MNSASFWPVGMSFLVFFQIQLVANDQSGKKTDSSKSSGASKVALSPKQLQQKYIAYCANCHGMDGRPAALVERVMPEIPDFSRFPWSDYDKQDVIDSIGDGTGQMPGFSKVLTKIEMDALAVMITKFPAGTPFSLIEKSSRYRKADGRLLEVFVELEDEFSKRIRKELTE